MTGSKKPFELVQAVLEHSPMGVLVTDHDGMILYVNQQICDLFGYNSDELLYLPVEILTPPQIRDKHVSLRQNYMAHNPQPRNLGEGRELYGMHKDGRMIPVEIALSPVTIDNESFVICTILNTSEKVLQEESEVSQIVHNLQRSNAELESFAAKVSHDLRAPLSVITASAALLERELGSSGQTHALLTKIQGASSRMQEMVTYLLDYAHLYSSGVNYEVIDLEDILAEVKIDLSLSIDKEDAKFESDPLPCIRGDKTQIRSVFQNIIGNAIKYRKPDVSPHLIISCREPDESCIELRFKDNGRGFKAEDIPHLFELFHRLSQSDGVEGKGIGLAAIKKIIEKHHGTIDVEAMEGEGATFIVTLPKSGK